MAYSATRYYMTPKERVANHFTTWPVQEIGNGVLRASVLISNGKEGYTGTHGDWAYITMTDYRLPDHILASIDTVIRLGVMGTKAVITSNSDDVGLHVAKIVIFHLKQFEF